MTAARALRGPNLWARVPVLEFAGDAALAHRVLELQIQCGCQVSFAGAREGRAAVEFEVEDLARQCLAGTADPVKLCELADELLLGPNTRALYEAAKRRGIPVRRLGKGSVLILGHGARQRRLEGARTDRTSAIAEAIGWEKPLAKELLEAAGLPMPEGRVVSDANDAWQAARELGGLVVVKPESANHGRAVFVGLSEREEIAAAYEAARVEGETTNVIVERMIAGAEHRVLVVDGRVSAAARGDALFVTGDGSRTVAELTDEVNRDPRRSDDPASPLYAVTLDAMTRATLARQGYGPESVPGGGVRVLVQRNGNLSVDVTEQVHPANAALCVLAAKAIGLDIAGIDLVVEDIGRPMEEQGGAFLEVNAMPGLMMHLRPGSSPPRPVDDIIVGALFPAGDDGRIPIVAVNGVKGLAAEIAAQLARAGVFARVGKLAGMLLDPRLEAAVFETPDSLIEEAGLPFDRCRLAVLSEGPMTPARRVLIDAADEVLYRAGTAESIARRVLRK